MKRGKKEFLNRMESIDASAVVPSQKRNGIIRDK